MNNLTKNKVLLSIVAILLATNIAMLILFFNMTHQEPRGPGFTDRLKTEVGFTPEQMKTYEPKKKDFREKMHQKLGEIKNTKEKFYYQMYDATIPDSVIEAKAEIIGKQQKELDLQVIRYFKDIRNLCTPEQLPKYDSLLPSVIKKITDKTKKR